MFRWAALCLAMLSTSCVLFSRLPADMPADFALTVEQSGGMLPYSTTVTYSPSGCRYHKSYLSQGQALEADFRFSLDPKELQLLYSALKAAPFDQVTTHHEEIYDRGGFQVTLKARGQTFTVIDGGQSVVDGFWLPAWKAIYDRLEAVEATALERAGARITFHLPPQVRNLPELYIGLDLKPVLSHPETPVESVTATVFPGTYALVMGASQTDPYDTQVVTIDGPRTFEVVREGNSLQAR